MMRRLPSGNEVDHARDHADAVEPLLGRVIVARPTLRDSDDALVRRHRAVDRTFRLFAPDEERRDHVRNDVADRHHRQVGALWERHRRPILIRGEPNERRVILRLDPGAQHIPIVKAEDFGDQLQAFAVGE
jgi:hypothetical protein